jgi:hypothetical protein
MGTFERLSMKELLAVEAVQQSIVLERGARDIGNWDEMARCYYDDTRIAVGWTTCSGAEFIEHTKKLAAAGDRGHGLHQLGPIQVALNGNRAVAELPAQIVMPVEIDKYEMTILVWERMCFRVEKRDHDWRIAEFRAIYLRDTLIPDHVGDVVTFDEELLASCRPSYRYTQYWSNQAGWGNHPDRPGLDRPDLIRAVHHANGAWLRGA